MADEIRDEPAIGFMIEIIRRVPLQKPAFVHDADHVAERERLVLVVGHEHRRGAVAFEDIAYFARNAFAQVDVEIGKRLVQQHHIRLQYQRPRQRHALLLAAGKFVRITPPESREPDDIEYFIDAAPFHRRRHVAQTETDIAGDVEMRGTARNPGTPCRDDAFRRQGKAAPRDEIAVEQYLTAFQRVESGDGAQHRGLAAAAGPEQARRCRRGARASDRAAHRQTVVVAALDVSESECFVRHVEARM